MQTMWLLGGLGLGVGLMYLLDPEKGAERRDVVRGFMEDYGRQTGDFFDDTKQTLGRQAQATLARTRAPFRRQPGLGERLRTQAEERGLSLGLWLLGSVGLGVGLGYLLEPQGGPSGAPSCVRKRGATGTLRRLVMHSSRSGARPGASSKAMTRTV